MRIIGQKKKINIPYEKICIEQDEREILAYDTADAVENSFWVIGKYKTKKRASEIMQEIIEKGHYIGTGNNWYQMPEE